MLDNFEWLNVPVEEAARRLLGCELEREIAGDILRVCIVETEAYDQTDEASHTYRGPTARNAAMFCAAGHAYVYFIHGIHHCLNIVTGVEDYGSGVLIRAAEPITGQEIMTERRGRGGIELTNGPGKICQALDIDLTLSGHSLGNPPLRLIKRPPLLATQIVATRRVGISKAINELRRFYIVGNPYVSKK